MDATHAGKTTARKKRKKPLVPRGLRISCKFSTALDTWTFFFSVRPEEVAAGCPVGPQPLGSEIGAAVEQAKVLKSKMDAWRLGRASHVQESAPLPVGGPSFGTFDWAITEYLSCRKALAMAPEGLVNRRWHLRTLAKFEIEDGVNLGSVPLVDIDALLVEDIYEEVLWTERHCSRTDAVERVMRRTTANHMMTYARSMWNEVVRLHRKALPEDVRDNPFGQMGLKHNWKKMAACTYREYTLVVDALLQKNKLSLAAGCMMMWEWLQRPHHVFRAMRCEDFRPEGRKNFCYVQHPKSASHVAWPLSWRFEQGKKPFVLTPDLEQLLDRIKGERRDEILLFDDDHFERTGKFAPLSLKQARKRLSQVMSEVLTRKKLTMRNLRYGGYTEVGAAGLTSVQMDQMGGRQSADVNLRYTAFQPAVVAMGQRKRLKLRERTSINDDLLFDLPSAA